MGKRIISIFCVVFKLKFGATFSAPLISIFDFINYLLTKYLLVFFTLLFQLIPAEGETQNLLVINSLQRSHSQSNQAAIAKL